jgi:hypothetical protein
MSNIKNFIKSIAAGNTATSASSLQSLIIDKVKTVLDIKRIELSASIYDTPKITESIVTEALEKNTKKFDYAKGLDLERKDTKFREAQGEIYRALDDEDKRALSRIIQIDTRDDDGKQFEKEIRMLYTKLLKKFKNVSVSDGGNPKVYDALNYVLDKI